MPRVYARNTAAAARLNLRPRVVMVRHTSFRLYRALRGLCSPRCFILVTMATVTLWLFPPPRWRDLGSGAEILTTDTTVPVVSSSLCGNGSSSRPCSSSSTSSSSSSPSSSSTSPAVVVVQNASSSTVPPHLASTAKLIINYLSQKPPMVGTGLGNLMFMHASMLGIADHAQMTPDYPDNGQLKDVFVVTTRPWNPAYSVSVQESKACAFDENLFALAKRNKNITVVGYLQSWRYFSASKDRVLQEFTFKDELRAPAVAFLRNILLDNKTSSTLYIGVHIRRKDMLANYNVVRGYTVASKEYLAAAVNHFRTIFTDSMLVFVVCTDDLDWSRKNFPMVDRNSFVAYSENRTAAQDMAILASCNHTIITVGTYGWWSGYLAGGQTIYYKDFPNPGTHLASLVKKEDYFPPTWIGL